MSITLVSTAKNKKEGAAFFELLEFLSKRKKKGRRSRFD